MGIGGDNEVGKQSKYRVMVVELHHEKRTAMFSFLLFPYASRKRIQIRAYIVSRFMHKMRNDWFDGKPIKLYMPIRRTDRYIIHSKERRNV